MIAYEPQDRIAATAAAGAVPEHADRGAGYAEYRVYAWPDVEPAPLEAAVTSSGATITTRPSDGRNLTAIADRSTVDKIANLDIIEFIDFVETPKTTALLSSDAPAHAGQPTPHLKPLSFLRQAMKSDAVGPGLDGRGVTVWLGEAGWVDLEHGDVNDAFLACSLDPPPVRVTSDLTRRPDRVRPIHCCSTPPRLTRSVPST